MIDKELLAERYTYFFKTMMRALCQKGVTEMCAQDLIHDTFRKAMKRCGKIVDREHLDNFLWKTLAHLRIDLFRKEQKLISLDAPENRVALTLLAQPEEAHHVNDCDTIKATIRKLTRRFSAALRNTYTLVFEKGLPVKTVAQQMHVSENLVKIRIFRIRKRLRPHLEKLYREYRQPSLHHTL